MNKSKRNFQRGVLTDVEYWSVRIFNNENPDRLIRILSLMTLSVRLNRFIHGQCVDCGCSRTTKKYEETTHYKMCVRSLCFNCLFWNEKIEDGRFFNVKGNSFFVGPNDKTGPFRGHGGAKFTIKYPDGSIEISRNVWSQGEIPEMFLSRFKTAEFI